MIFNSIEYLLFLPIVFALYWLLGRRPKLQNAFVVVASYLFYGWWNWRFLFLIAFTTLCSYLSGRLIAHSRRSVGAFVERRVNLITLANILINLLVLGLFKYYDFFVESLARLIPALHADHLLLHVVLPVGISFYTFQALSYTIDVRRRTIEPSRDLIAFAAYVSFFPQLVAGPIERATHLLPQFLQSRSFDYAMAVDGMRQMLWGFVKKVLVADGCAQYVDTIWADYGAQSGSSLLLAAILFSLQIYGDFSGYSDIAIGTAKLFGIRLMRNFNVPYFSRDIAEFWRRWHISLTTWFRDYLYIPLGGSRAGRSKALRNTFIIFLVSGLWHGANWTYVAWGLYHALLFVPLLLLGRNRRYRDVVAAQRALPSLADGVRILVTFLLTVVGWVIFRSPDLPTALHFLRGIASSTLLSPAAKPPAMAILFSGVMLVAEWIGRREEHGLSRVRELPTWLRLLLYYALVASLLLFSFSSESFIYFQF